VVSGVVGFGSYQAAMADAENVKSDVTELKEKVTKIAEKSVENGTVSEVNSTKIDAVVETLQRMETANAKTNASLESLVQHLLNKDR
jgi:hypothetical protein